VQRLTEPQIPGDQNKLVIHKETQMVEVGRSDDAQLAVNHGCFRMDLSSRRRKILVDTNAVAIRRVCPERVNQPMKGGSLSRGTSSRTSTPRLEARRAALSTVLPDK
jgi:hypothetical protein